MLKYTPSCMHLKCVATVCDGVLPYTTQISWGVGSALESLLAFLVMTNIPGDNAWRWLLGLSTLPVVTVMILYPVSV